MIQTTERPKKPVVVKNRTNADYDNAIIILSIMFNDTTYTNKIIKQKKKDNGFNKNS